MNIKTLLLLLVNLICINSYCQELKNNFEIGALGNIGFINVGYSRSVLNFEKFSLNVGPKLGYVPGSHEEKKENQQNNSSFPNFVHLNFITESIYKFSEYHQIGAGVSYSKIFVLADDSNVREKNNYNRILGEIHYAYLFNSSYSGQDGIKISFCPIIHDNGALDVQNIPIRISFITIF